MKLDLKRIFDNIPNSIVKQEYALTFTVEMWKLLSDTEMYSMTHEQIDNAINGYIGEFNGVKCYITPLFT